MQLKLNFPKAGSKRKLARVLGKILNNIFEIQEELSNTNQIEFAKNRRLHNSIYLDLATIGELLKSITGNPDDENTINPDPYNLMHSFPEVQWSDIKGFRDITDHNYFILNPNMVWNSATIRIEHLKNAINKISENYPEIKEEIENTIKDIKLTYNNGIKEAECQVKLGSTDPTPFTIPVIS